MREVSKCWIRRRRRGVVAVPLGVAILSALAFGYFTSAGASTVTGNVGQLTAPTVTATPGAGSVTLSWNAVAAPADATVTYYVTRTGGTVSGTCPSSAASAAALTSCTDSGLSRGTYTYTVTAVWQSWTATSSTTSATLTSGSLDHFSVSAPATATAGTAFNVTLTAQDANNNTVSTFTGSQTIGFSGPSNAPDGTDPTYPASVAFTAGTGTASVTLFDAQVTTLTAAQGSASGTSKSLTVSPGANHQIAASTSTPQTAGTAFNVSLSAQDRWDNSTGNLSGSKAMAFSGPKAAPNGNSPSYPANVTFTAGAGTASVTLYDAQTTTITAKDSTDNLVGVASGSLTVNSASPQSFSVPTPTTRTAGTAFNEKLTAFDAYGNTATTYTGSQAVSFSDPASSPNGTAPTYPASVSFASGVGTASITLVDAQTTPLTATQGTLTGTSGSFVVQARTASQLTFLTQPGGASAGAAFSSQPVLTAFDSFGNTVTSYAKSVSLSIKSGTGTAGSILSGCTSSLSTGVTTFSGCQINNSGSSFQLSASDGSLTSTSNAFDVRGGTTVTESAPGTYSLTVPAGVTGFNFTMNGGGGGGGGAGASGAAGGTVSGTIVIPSSASSTTFTVIVGGGGASGAPASGGAGGSSGTGCALGGNGGAGATDGGGGGGGATCINLFGAPAVTIVSVGGGGGGGGGANTGSGGSGGGGPTSNPGSNTAANGTTAGSETGGKGAKTATTGVFPFLITNTAGAAGTGTGGANGSAGGTCSGGSCTTGGAGGGGSSNGGGGGGGGWASGGGGGGGLNASNAGGGGGGGSAYTGGTQSGSSNYAVTVSAASNGGGSAGGSANTSGIPGAVNFTGVGLTLA